jgi:hypothetical protein
LKIISHFLSKIYLLILSSPTPFFIHNFFNFWPQSTSVISLVCEKFECRDFIIEKIILRSAYLLICKSRTVVFCNGFLTFHSVLDSLFEFDLEVLKRALDVIFISNRNIVCNSFFYKENLLNF